MNGDGQAMRLWMLGLGAALIGLALPASAQAAFPGANGEIRVSVRDDSFNNTYTAIDPATGDASLVPGVPAGLYSQARSSADGRTIAFNDQTLGRMQVIRDGSSIGTLASCGPVLVEESRVLHTRRADPDAGCSGALASFGVSTSEEPFGDQTVDALAAADTLAVAGPGGDAFYYSPDGDTVMRVGATGAEAELVPTGEVGESDPGNDCDCFIFFREVRTKVVDVSPDGEKLLITREVTEYEQCYGDDSSGGFCDVNPSVRNLRTRFVVAEADTGSGQLTELTAFSTPFVSGGRLAQPPERVPLGYSPDGDELLLEGNTSRLGDPAQGEDPNTFLFTSKALVRADFATGLEEEIRVLDDPPGDEPTFVAIVDAQWLPGGCPVPPADPRRRSVELTSSGAVPGSGTPAPAASAPKAGARRAGKPGSLDIRKVEPGEAVPGAAVNLRGRGLTSKSLRAKVGGKKARVSTDKKAETLLVVPKLRPGKYRVVVRRGSQTASAALRVVKPFDGSPSFALDSGARRTATIGPGGGSLSARGSNGVEFELSIPAGALTATHEIALTPVKRFGGLPFSGADVAGAALEPDGLQLAQPGTLAISGGGNFNSDTVAFAFGDASEFEVAAPVATGRRIVLPVSHFSQHGAAEASEADIASALQPIVDSPRSLSRSQVRYLLGLLALFDERFSAVSGKAPPSFCLRQPVCQQAVVKGISSMEAEVAATCIRGKAQPNLFVLRDLADLGSDLEILTSESTAPSECSAAVADLIVENLTTALSADLLARFQEFELPSGFSGDIDADGEVSAFEMARALIGEFDLLSLDDQARKLDAASGSSLAKLLERNRALCETDARDAAAVALRRGFAYARSIGSLQAEFLDALRACGVGVVVSPANVEMGTEDERLFEAILTNAEAADAGSVTWSTNGGSIGSDGLFANYTAPLTEGQFTVTATSTVNPSRTASARVTVDDEFCGPPREP